MRTKTLLFSVLTTCLFLISCSENDSPTSEIEDSLMPIDKIEFTTSDNCYIKIIKVLYKKHNADNIEEKGKGTRTYTIDPVPANLVAAGMDVYKLDEESNENGWAKIKFYYKGKVVITGERISNSPNLPLTLKNRLKKSL